MQVKFSLLYGSTIPLLCLLQILSLPQFLSKHEKNVIFESSVSKFFPIFPIYFYDHEYAQWNHIIKFLSILLFKQNKIRSLTDFSTKKPALRENISLFYLFLFFKNKNILWILLQCSWCDILSLPIFRRRLLLHTSAQKICWWLTDEESTKCY